MTPVRGGQLDKEEIELKNEYNEDEIRQPQQSNPSSNMKKYTVQDCSKLNIRREPKLNAGIIAIVENGDYMFVDTSYHDRTFYKVRTQNGLKGYAVKLYLKPNN